MYDFDICIYYTVDTYSNKKWRRMYNISCPNVKITCSTINYLRDMESRHDTSKSVKDNIVRKS